MIEFAVQIIVELFGELLFNVLIEGASRGVSAALSNRVTRLVLSALLSAGAGFAGGFWWGRRLSDVRETQPKTLYVAALLAAVFALAAIVRARNAPAEITAPGGFDTPPVYAAALRRPWVDAYWSPERLASFAIVNAAVAIGILAGFRPYVPG